MRHLPLLAAVLLIVGLGAWVLAPGLLPGLGADLSGYAAQKASAAPSHAATLAARPLSVEAAYRAIPHARTPFSAGLARMTPGEADYLEALFRLTDAGVVERVYLQSRMHGGDMEAGARSNYTGLLARLRAMETPEDLLPVEALVFEAIEEQRRYLGAWRESGDRGYFSPRAPLVSSSHRKLIAAYSELMRLYPKEPAHNKRAFYDHLCALDFI